jgi:hypothetical protein
MVPPTDTNTPVPPSPTNTLIPPSDTPTVTPELLPLSGEWQAKSVDNSLVLSFTIEINDGEPALQVISGLWRGTCSGKSTRLTIHKQDSTIPIENGKFESGFLKGEVSAQDHIEGTYELSPQTGCGGMVLNWIATIEEPTPTP